MAHDRAFPRTVVVLLFATAALHALGAGPWRDGAWGVHLYAFLPAALLPLALALLLAALLLQRQPARAGVDAAMAAPRLPGAAWRLALAVAVALALWLARERHLLLGDAASLVVSLPDGEAFHARQPLTALVQHALYRMARGIVPGEPEAVAALAVAFGSVLAGALFALVAVDLARELLALSSAGASARATRAADVTGVTGPPANPILVALLALVLFFQGYVQLFFGHVENYSYLALGVALYLWLALRHLRGAAPLVAPATAVLLAIACHLSAVVLVPSFAVLAVAGVLDPARRTAAVRDLTIAVALIGALWAVLGRLGGGYDLLREIASVTGLVAGGAQEQPGYLFSARHLRDMVQQQLLIGPLGVWLFLPALAVALSARRAGSAAAWVLAVAAAGYLAACVVAGDSNLGYARNWDLLAPAGIVFTAAGLGFFMIAGVGAGPLRGGLGVALALSLFHTLPWIAVNASFERSFERLKALPLGFGRTGTAVGRWYLVNGDPVSARAWLVKALDEYPSNNNAHFLMGMLYEGEGDLPRAAIAYGAAVQLRPDKVEYRARLADVLDRLGRHAEAESLRTRRR